MELIDGIDQNLIKKNKEKKKSKIRTHFGRILVTSSMSWFSIRAFNSDAALIFVTGSLFENFLNITKVSLSISYERIFFFVWLLEKCEFNVINLNWTSSFNEEISGTKSAKLVIGPLEIKSAAWLFFEYFYINF